MTTALTSPAHCHACTNSVEENAKFCGECGTITQFGSGVYQALPEDVTSSIDGTTNSDVTYDDLALLESYRLAQRSGSDVQWAPTPTPTNNQGEVIEHTSENVVAPGFVQKSQATPRQKGVSESLIREMQSLNALLLREKFFLVMHWSIFLAANLLGLYLASKCYYGFMGDEVTRFVLALTPLTFINATALACLAPIKGTKREISRVKERLQYIKVQLEYSDLL